MNLGRLSYRYEAGGFYIVLSRNPKPPHNTHAGLMYNDGGQGRLLHLAMHQHLENDPIYEAWQDLASQDIGFINPDIDEATKLFLSNFCWFIGESRISRTIPYAFEEDSELVFDVMGDASKLVDGKGLTCATFVLKVFESVGIKVIDRSEWPITDEDRKTQRRIVRHLKSEGYTKQAEIIESEISRNIHRVSPEQVAGAFLEDSSAWPVGHLQCTPNSNSVCCKIAWPFGPGI